EVLLQNGAQANIPNNLGQLPIHRAASLGHLKLLKLLHQFQSPLDRPDRHGNTPLHLACEEGHLEVIHYLLDQGVNPISKNHEGQLPFDLADPSFQKVLRRHPETAEVMVPNAI
ncbi:hypothetical protein HMI55_005526, partial [Coelomomyces lativittatus]